MRLLGIIFAALLPLSAGAVVRDCTGVTTEEISACNELRYKDSDAQLNVTYKKALSALPATHRKQFINTQRAWISFKEKHCADIYKSIFPGREAKTEKYICLWKSTDDRVNEIERLDELPYNDVFLNFLLSLEDIGLPRVEIVSKLKRRYVNEKDGWQSYAEKNCHLVEAISSENYDLCIARISAQRGVN